jgi:hypothetical protein
MEIEESQLNSTEFDPEKEETARSYGVFASRLKETAKEVGALECLKQLIERHEVR